MKQVLFVLSFIFFNSLIAQPDSLFIKDKRVKEIRPEWKQVNKLSVDLNEVTFVNWNSGGSNSLSALFGCQFAANYSDKYFRWDNKLTTAYGLNGQQGRETRKTADLIEFSSNLGYKPEVKGKWLYSARLNFKTQFADGFKYPNISKPISTFMAPGYLFFGGGMEYGQHIKELSMYFSPLTLKTTFVLDEDLANVGAFGVDEAVYDSEGNIIRKGDSSRSEVGILFTNTYELDIAKNVTAKNLLSLYSDYINNFGNVDLDWRVNFDFKVNDYIRATLESHLKYDDDVKTSIPTEIKGEFDEAGAKIQWKQFLGIGFAVDF